MKYYTDKIISLLSNNEYLTCEKLAAKLDISEKTVRKKIAEANEELADYGVTIIRRPRLGCALKITDPELYIQSREIENNASHIPQIPDERARFILIYLLEHNDYVRMDELCEALYVSRSTLTADLKRTKKYLEIYHLGIESRPHYGVRLKGSEFDKRRCIAGFMIKYRGTNPQQLQDQDRVSVLVGILQETIRDEGLRLTENAFESLLMHTYVACRRIQEKCPIQFSPEAISDIHSHVSEKACNAAEVLAARIESAFGIHCEEDEQLYFALHISGKSDSGSQSKYGSILVPAHIDELVMQMLAVLYEGNGLDFRTNLELRMALNQHMVPLDIRMRYNIPLSNPLLQQIKCDYSMAYTVAALASSVLANHYGREIPEDEIGYLAILFALALEKQGQPVRRRNIVIVCMSGRCTGQLFIYKYKQAFGDYIDHIYDCTVFELKDFDFKGKDIDYVFTTVPVSIPVPVPIFEISQLINEDEIVNYRRMFQRGDRAFLYQYYSPELFFPNLRADSREEALKKLISMVGQKKNLPEDYLDSVMLREERGQTDFGNLIAIPHAFRAAGDQKFVAVAILENPIWWGHNYVQVILLLCFAANKDPDTERFYQSLTNFMFDESGVASLIKKRSFDTLISALLGMEN